MGQKQQQGHSSLEPVIAALVVGLTLCAAAIYLPPLIQPMLRGEQLIDCAPPGEFERLQIVVTRRGEHTFVARCEYLGSRGTYNRERRR